MKKVLWLLMIVMVVSVLPVFSAESAVPGKIIDILDNGIITIQLSKGHHLRGGDTVSLTYMAGSLPMAIGDYKITTTTNIICLAKPLVMSMPPSNGMNVSIIPVENQQQPDKKALKPTQVQIPPLPKSTITGPIEIIGSVVAVNGDEITVEKKGAQSPQAGWFVDLFYVTSQGKELPVGTWKVQSVTGQKLTAIKVKGVGNANKNLKAIIYNKKKTVSSHIAAPPDRQVSTTPRNLAPQQPQQHQKPQPTQRLGQTAPTRKVTPNPRKKQPSLPPGVTKKKIVKKKSRPRNPEVTQLLNQLTSHDFREKRTAAKIISRKRFTDPVIYRQVEKELLNDYLTARDKLSVDTLAWLCKALASSKDHKYYETLYTVARKAKSRKVRKYAKKTLKQLR